MRSNRQLVCLRALHCCALGPRPVPPIRHVPGERRWARPTPLDPSHQQYRLKRLPDDLAVAQSCFAQ